jgi:hypothetical protein
MARGKISFARGIQFCAKFLFLFRDHRLNIVNMCIYTHIADCVENVYELLLLTNNTASETFLHKSERCEILTGCFSFGRRPGGD